jgi:hypothetical protein
MHVGLPPGLHGTCFKKLFNKNLIELSAFDIITAVTMSNVDFWNVKSFIPLEFRRIFGRLYCLLLHGRFLVGWLHDPDGGISRYL